MADISYVPGGQTAMVSDACCMLISAPPDAPVVTDLWRRVTAGPGLEAIIAGLVASGLTLLPDFALLTLTNDRYHVLCRGDAAATTMTPGGGTARVTGAGLVTWLDHPVPSDVSTIVLGALPS